MAVTSRCEFTDLEPSMCAHCRPPAEPEPRTTAEPEPSPAGRWFHAVYPGTCADCRTPFPVGTAIRMHHPAGWIADCCDTPTW